MTWEYAAVISIAFICASFVSSIWIYFQRSDVKYAEELKKLESEVSKLRMLESRVHQVELNLNSRGVFR